MILLLELLKKGGGQRFVDSFTSIYISIKTISHLKKLKEFPLNLASLHLSRQIREESILKGLTPPGLAKCKNVENIKLATETLLDVPGSNIGCWPHVFHFSFSVFLGQSTETIPEGKKKSL